jgi:hypothetical protein
MVVLGSVVLVVVECKSGRQRCVDVDVVGCRGGRRRYVVVVVVVVGWRRSWSTSCSLS